MTKVKSIKAGKRAGKVPADAKEKAVIDGKKLVSATRDGKTRTFTTLTWELLPPNKDGWVLSSEKPADLSANTGANGNVDTRSAEQRKLDDAIAAYKETFGKDPEEGQTVEQLNQAVKDYDEDDYIEIEVSQEFLDTHPDVAAQGIKVGDIYKVKEDEA